MTQKRIEQLKRKLQESRYRIINKDRGKNIRVASLSLHIIYVATKDVYRISTNGECIFFDPDWLQKLGQKELDFILLHELLHIKEGHIKRRQIYKGDRFHLGCDIIANANLIEMGYEFSHLNGIGKIYYETFFPSRIYGLYLDPENAFNNIPFDPKTLPVAKRRQYMIDSDEWWDKALDDCKDKTIILTPQDEVPNDLSFSDFITQKIELLGETKYKDFKFKKSPNNFSQNKSENNGSNLTLKQLLEALRKRSNSNSSEHSEFNELFWQKLRNPKLNWKEILNNFVQENIFDYSFTPPDKRFVDSSFYLPSYNDNDCVIKDIIFMIDTSGSIDNDALMKVYSELCAAIEQFNNKVKGLLGFFDVRVKNKLFQFETVEDLYSLIPIGGGGTVYSSVFDYIATNQNLDNIASIVIFTDGKGEYPKLAPFNVPVLWILNEDSPAPPFGTVARI